MFFHSDKHERRFESLISQKIIPPNSKHNYISALFVLTATTCLWHRSMSAVNGGDIDFGRIDISGLKIGEMENYALFKTAKELYKEAPRIDMQELSCENILGDRAFLTIINAFAVRRYGLKAIK